MFMLIRVNIRAILMTATTWQRLALKDDLLEASEIFADLDCLLAMASFARVRIFRIHFVSC